MNPPSRPPRNHPAGYLPRFRLAAFALAFSLGLAGCSVPTLDTTGKILCDPSPAGDSSGCPMGMDCHWGHCCPTEGGVGTTCPAGLATGPARDETGGVYACEGDGVCPVGYNCRWGHCCPNDAPNCPTVLAVDNTGLNYLCSATNQCPGGYACNAGSCCRTDNPARCSASRLGRPCTDDSSCRNTTHPLAGCVRSASGTGTEEFPGGYCLAACDPNAAVDTCAPDGICFSTSQGGICYARCTTPAVGAAGRCRVPSTGTSQYVCVPVSSTNPEGICEPDCTVVPSLCTFDPATPRVCDPHFHSCSDRCTDDAFCRSIAPDQPTIVCTADSYCAVPCNDTHPCPVTTICNPDGFCGLDFRE